MKWLFSLMLISLVFACQNSNSADNEQPKEDSAAVEPAPQPTPEPEQPTQTEADRSTPEGFIAAFKEAFKNKDINALNAMSDLEHEVYDEVFFNTYITVIDNLSADNLEKAADMPDAWQFQLEVEGGEAMLFYVKQTDGQYTIVQTMGIG